MGIRTAKPISLAVQHVIDRTLTDFTPDDVLLSTKISNEYSREFVSRVLDGDPIAISQLYTNAKEKGWVKRHQTEAVDKAMQHIALVRLVSGSR